MRNRLFTTLIFCLAMNYAFAQISINAEIRARSEYRDGSRILLDDTMNPAFVSSQRSRLITGFIDDKFELKFTIQNARIWGQDDERSNVSNTNLSEGWLKYNFNDAFSIKVGRQHLVLDDGRIFGMRNWNDIAVSHDLAQVMYKKNDLTLQLGGAYNNQSNIYSEADYTLSYYKYLVFFHANKKYENGLEFSLLHSTDANQDPADFIKVYKRNTTGLYVKLANDGPFGLQASAYYQYGKHTSGLDQRAFLISIIPTYKINDKLRTAVGVNQFSGNDQLDAGSTTNRSFNKLFGDGHRYYGYLDYFLNVESNTKGVGVNEIFASVFYKTSDKGELELSFHNFAVAGKLLDPTAIIPSSADATLGNEIDVQYKHKINKYFNAAFSYSTMFATSSMEILKGGDSRRYQQWAMVMLTVKPELFKSEKK